MKANQLLKQSAAAGLVLLTMAGCSAKKLEPQVSQIVPDTCTMQELDALAEVSAELTVWTAYWDCEDDLEIMKQKHELIDGISLFEAYFQQDGSLFVPDVTARMKKRLGRKTETADIQTWISIVNDVNKDGKIQQKDTEILRRLMSDPAKAEKHVEQLVQLAVENGYQGVEIDYEKIRKDLDLWQDFFEFEQILIEKAQEKGLKVRILLEPSTPVSELTFPQGAEYVLMCYNLYGNGTQPGPKADLAFLTELFEKFQGLPGLSYALANGGYEWVGSETKATQIRTAQVQQILDENGITPERDPASGALHFQYQKAGETHTVWYADAETLRLWAQTLGELAGQPVNISLWRI